MEIHGKGQRVEPTRRETVVAYTVAYYRSYNMNYRLNYQ